MKIHNYGFAAERHDDGSASVTIRHGGEPLVLELNPAQARMVGETLLGWKVVADRAAADVMAASRPSRRDG